MFIESRSHMWMEELDREDIKVKGYIAMVSVYLLSILCSSIEFFICNNTSHIIRRIYVQNQIGRKFSVLINSTREDNWLDSQLHDWD